MKHKHGMIDIGSNTMRLVIYEHKKGKGFKQIENIKVVARLRNYLNEEQILTKEGINILLETLQTFQIITRHHELQHVNCVATATVRQASNRDEIVQLVDKQTDFSMKILSEYEEAFYGFFAVVHSTSIEEAITIDIGGGSTEVTYFRDRELIEYHSFPFGALSLSLQFVKKEIPTMEEKLAIRNFVLKQFESLPWLRNRQVPIVAIGGSARNLVQLHQNFIQYPLAGVHQYEMSLQDILHVKSAIEPYSYTELQKLEGLSKDRADTILPAIEVFQALCEVVLSTRFILSRKGLREGVLFKEANDANFYSMYSNVIEKSFQELMDDFEINKSYVQEMTRTAIMLFQHLRVQQISYFNNEDLEMLRKAAQVFHLGEYIDSESSSQHTFYLLANRTIDGISHIDRLKLALVASYKDKSAFRQYVAPFKEWISKEEQRKLLLLGALLKLSTSLNATKRNVVKHIELKETKEGIIFVLLCDGNYRAEEYQAEKQKKHLEKLLKKPITLEFKMM
ncbi:Ppx/GppA family phosphatase [Priestia megaterium]|nr:Ppx/GppA family phosphatase [Priestia megaterium]